MPELTALGHRFRTRSDTEVIVHAWESWGEDCVKRFRGMFAFAIWDRIGGPCSLRATVSASSRCITRFCERHARLRVRAEVPAGASGMSARSIDPRAIEDYFALGYVPEPRTIFTVGLSNSRRRIR